MCFYFLGPRRKEDQDRPWEPHAQPNMKFQPGPHQPHPDELGPENWGPPREPPMDNRGPRGNDPRFGPGQDFQRGPHFKRGPKNQGRDGILGSPPHGKPDMWSRPPPAGLGLLGPAPPPLPGPPDSRHGGILGQHPAPEQNAEHDMRRPGDIDEERDPRDPHDSRGHPNDLSSRGFRRGMGRGGGPRRGNEPNRQQDQGEERNGDNRPRGPPFQRGFNPNGRGAPQGDDNRRPWQPGGEPSDPRFRRHDGPPDRRPFERPQWDEPMDDLPRDDMGQPNHHREFAPHDPRAGPYYGRGGPPNDIDPRGPDQPERRSSDDSQRSQDGKPRPLMSLMSINTIVPPRNHEREEPDRPPLHRKRSGEGEHEREWECPPQQKHRFPPPGPPEERHDIREGRPFPEDQIGWRGRGGMR